MKYFLTISALLLCHLLNAQTIRLPIQVSERTSMYELNLTEIGQFGLQRKARPDVKSHLHTGIDIKRPGANYSQNPIFPIAKGRVISKREDGPFAQIIIEHNTGNEIFWTVYEHIAGIKVSLHEHVDPFRPIARFMNRKELDKYGWQFDHFHLEILKIPPRFIQPTGSLPERHFQSYTLICFKEEDLDKYFYAPLEFLRVRLN